MKLWNARVRTVQVHGVSVFGVAVPSAAGVKWD